MKNQELRTAGQQLFRHAFGRRPSLGASAPGRVNLLGEHTDYNGGPVLPMALDRRTLVLARRARTYRLASTLDQAVVERSLDDGPRGHWSDYVIGAARELASIGCHLNGAELAVSSSVPAGAGLSSSAALTVSAAGALAALARFRLTRQQLVEIAWRAESAYVGVRCGRMDQTVSVFGKARHALAFDTASGTRRLVPFAGTLTLIDSGLRHALVAGEYEHRRIECEEALRRCRTIAPDLASLAAIAPGSLSRFTRMLPAVLGRLVRHVVTETARVHEAVAALNGGRLTRLGELLFKGHESLRGDFASSCDEADAIVRHARRAGALGARLTGAGWGGVVIVLSKPGEGEALVGAIQEAFARQFGHSATAWTTRAGGGSRLERS